MTKVQLVLSGSVLALALAMVMPSAHSASASSHPQGQSPFSRMARACELHETFEIDGRTYVCVNWPKR